MGVGVDLTHGGLSSQISAADVESLRVLTRSARPSAATFKGVTRRVHLGELTWTELTQRASAPVLLIPVGSTEQHGPHLPLATDTLIAESLAQVLMTDLIGTHESAEAEPPCLIGPTLQVTSSGEHADFVGTLSIGAKVTEQTLIELTRSADWARGLLLINGHGGNHHSVSTAIALLTTEQRNITAWWPQIPAGDLHAGHSETSIMMYLHPELVRTDRVEPGAVRLTADDLHSLRSQGVRAVSENGVLGDPRPSTAAAGEDLFNKLRADLLATYLKRFPNDALSV
jgi:mycofactocin system creatininase family protein